MKHTTRLRCRRCVLDIHSTTQVVSRLHVTVLAKVVWCKSACWVKLGSCSLMWLRWNSSQKVHIAKKLQKSSHRDPHALTIVRSRSCRAMENPELSAEEKIKYLRISVKRHQVLITKNIWLVQYSNLVLTTCFCPGALQGLYEWQGNWQTFVCTLRRFKRTRTRKPLISSFLSSFFLSSSCVSLGLRLLEASTDVALDTVNKSTTTTANV
jgi:hypothetical protein